MGVKAEYINALRRVIDDDDAMTAITSRTLPTLPTISAGASDEAANLAVSQYCANLNEFLKLFEGLPVLQYLLNGCALSPVFHNIHLSGLEYQYNTLYDFEVLSPQESVVYDMAEMQISCTMQADAFAACKSVSFLIVELNKGGGLEPVADVKGFKTIISPVEMGEGIPIGTYTMIITAYFGEENNSRSKTISFGLAV